MPGVRDAAARRPPEQRRGLFSDTIKRWRRAFVDGGPAENQRPRRRRAHLAFDSRLGLSEDAGARGGTRGVDPPRPGCPRPTRPSPPPRPAPPRAREQGEGGREGGGGSARGVTKPSRIAGLEPETGEPRPGGAEGASAQRPPSPPPPRAPLGRPAQRRRPGRSGAAKRPGRAGSRRKDARALGGGEVIKGKEPAAGGSGRFGCCRRCCLASGPPEGRSPEGRRCRPQ